MIKFTFTTLSCALLICFFNSCDSGGSSNNSIIDIDTESSDEPSIVRIDPQLRPGLDIFLAEAAARNITLNQSRLNNLRIIFDDLDDETLGLCTVRSDGSNLIQINDSLRGIDNSFTVIHELGHCILRMEHRNDVLSIMNTFDTEEQVKQLPRKQVFDEFFTESLFEAF